MITNKLNVTYKETRIKDKGTITRACLGICVNLLTDTLPRYFKLRQIMQIRTRESLRCCNNHVNYAKHVLSNSKSTSIC